MKPLGIHTIVEKDEGSYTKYTKRALFYQDILRYYFVIKETNMGPFKDRKLTYWLLENNQELKSDHVDSDKHTAPSKRMEYRLERVQRSVQDLINLGLMLEAGTVPDERGGTRPVKNYGFTQKGSLLACLIEGFVPSKREKANNEGYNVIQSILSVDPASYNIFHSALHRKYKERGVFGEFIMDRLRQSLESHSEIKTMGELLYSSLIVFRTSDASKGNLYLDLWDETFKEMSSFVQGLLLFNMKMEIEQRMAHWAKAPQTYEKACFRVVGERLWNFCKYCMNAFSTLYGSRSPCLIPLIRSSACKLYVFSEKELKMLSLNPYVHAVA